MKQWEVIIIAKSPEHFLIDAFCCQEGMQEKDIYMTRNPKLLREKKLL